MSVVTPTSFFRDAKFDVVVVAGPRIDPWPTAGTRALSTLCAEMGLSAGLFGGDTLSVRGVIPLPGTGSLVIVEDVQKRVHRIHARAVVKVSSDPSLPDPFPGWRSQGLIPISTAERLRNESQTQIQWDPATVILGTGNRALRFASSLLESGVLEVYCVESYAQWGAKRFAGWEVERRRFESLGGRLIEALPYSLSAKGPLLWEFRLQDNQGIRLLEVARVVAAGPFRDEPAVREHPPGSFQFELVQTSGATKADDVEGWVLDEERGRWLAGKIVKSLVQDLGSKRDELDRIYKRAKGRMKRYEKHRGEPFTPSYQGKWVAVEDSRKLRAFSGVPQKDHRARLVASIECFEEIPCNLCMTSCPENAIEIGRVPRAQGVLNESKCTACGLCLNACPSGATLMIQERGEHSLSKITLPWRGIRPWQVGEFAIVVNRRGENLGSARVTQVEGPNARSMRVQQVHLDVPTHLVWEARGLKRGRPDAALDEAYLAAASRSSSSAEKVEILLNGEKRLVRDRVPVSVGLFETGQSRPDDILFCPDGSCGLCQVTIDGVKKLACQTKLHRGMSIKLMETSAPNEEKADDMLCPCLSITKEEVINRMQNGKLQSPEAVLSVTHVGEGRCHGQLCMGAFRRLMLDQGLDASQWVDWRFPWSEWVVTRN